MKRRRPSIERCESKWDHTFAQGVCLKCFELDDHSKRQRAFTAKLHRLMNDPEPFAVPPPPDYSTPAAVRARCLEGGTSPWYRQVMTQTSRLYTRFRKAIEKSGGQLELLPAAANTVVGVCAPIPAARPRRRKAA